VKPFSSGKDVNELSDEGMVWKGLVACWIIARGVFVAVAATTVASATAAATASTVAVAATTVASIVAEISIDTVSGDKKSGDKRAVEDVLPAAELEEVVVTAMNIPQQRKQLGYTTQRIEAKRLAEAQTMNIGNALSGQIAGLTVANRTGLFQAPTLSLRGRRPLVVLDGIPVETDFFNLNTEDIESVNVLKGPTASALYGARGKNGAILFTTRSAQGTAQGSTQGTAQGTARGEGLEVTLTTTTMMTAGFTVYPKAQNVYGSGSNYQYEFWDGQNGGISDGDMTWGPKLDAGLKVPQWNSPLRNKTTGETIPWWGDLSGTAYNDKSLYERVAVDFVSHGDNLSHFLRTGIVTRNNLAVTSRSAVASYYFSTHYDYQQGQVPYTSLSTGGLLLKASFTLSPSFGLEASLSAEQLYTPNYPRYGYGPKNHIYTLLLWMGSDVDVRELERHRYVRGQEGYRQANYNYAWYNNPYFAAAEWQQPQHSRLTDAKVSFRWQILPALSLQGRTALRENRLFEEIKSPKSYLNFDDPRNGNYSTHNASTQTLDGDLLLSYSRSLTGKLTLALNTGVSLYRRLFHEENQSTDGLILPDLYSLANSAAPVTATNDLSEQQTRSAYATANLDFDDALFLHLTARADNSSTLPPAHDTYFYPSLSLSALLSRYLRLPSFVDYLRASASVVSVSASLPPYSIYPLYEKGVTYGQTPSVSYPGTIVNADIRPDRSISYEAGLSAAFLHNRLAISLAAYRIIDDNQIIDLPLSEASGFSARRVNGNRYSTGGIEAIVRGHVLSLRTFDWQITLNWSHYVTRLTDIYGGGERYGNLRRGERADTYYATVWQRDGDKLLLLDVNGLPSKDPVPQALGHTNPDWTFGLLNSFRIGQFEIGVDIDGAVGGLFRSITTEKLWWGGRHPESVAIRDAELAAGGAAVYVPQGVVRTEGEVSANTRPVRWQTWCQVYPYQAAITLSEDPVFANVFPRTFVKLRRLSIGYAFPRLSVTLFGNNLAVWKRVPYVDPDFGEDDNLQDPSARYAGLSLSYKF
jgi:TonB-dependent SusC/RagA subfamily outer membrane receptor